MTLVRAAGMFNPKVDGQQYSVATRHRTRYGILCIFIRAHERHTGLIINNNNDGDDNNGNNSNNASHDRVLM